MFEQDLQKILNSEGRIADRGHFPVHCTESTTSHSDMPPWCDQSHKCSRTKYLRKYRDEDIEQLYYQNFKTSALVIVIATCHLDATEVASVLEHHDLAQAICKNIAPRKLSNQTIQILKTIALGALAVIATCHLFANKIN